MPAATTARAPRRTGRARTTAFSRSRPATMASTTAAAAIQAAAHWRDSTPTTATAATAATNRPSASAPGSVNTTYAPTHVAARAAISSALGFTMPARYRTIGVHATRTPRAAR